MTKRKIRVIWDYPCFPIWVYDEKGELIANSLPDELSGDEEFYALCRKLQLQYNSLFLDNEKEFSYIGFNDPDEEKQFYSDVEKMCDLLK